MMVSLFNHHTKRASKCHCKMNKLGMFHMAWRRRYLDHVGYAESAERVGLSILEQMVNNKP